MDRFGVVLVIACLILRDTATGYKPFVENDCGFADREELKFMCKGAISSNFEKTWEKVSPPEGTLYSLWQSPHDLIAMAAFYDSIISGYSSVMLDPSGARIESKAGNGEYNIVQTPHAQVFCYNTELPLVSALMHNCLGPDHVLNNPKHTILHYSAPEGKLVSSANKLTSAIMLTPLTTALVAFVLPMQT